MNIPKLDFDTLLILISQSPTFIPILSVLLDQSLFLVITTLIISLTMFTIMTKFVLFYRIIMKKGI